MSVVHKKLVYGVPSELKPIRGISPLAGTITLTFDPKDMAVAKHNNGPRMALEDCGDHWNVLPCGDPPNRMTLHNFGKHLDGEYEVAYHNHDWSHVELVKRKEQ